MNAKVLRVTVWNEFRHEQNLPEVAKIYPQGIHETLAAALRNHLGDRVECRTATLDQPHHGLTDEVLDQTDVMLWWGHAAHDEVSDQVVAKVQQRTLEGMGLIVLHSAHFSKIFRNLLGTSCALRWREAGEREKLWIVNPSHPILNGIESESIELPATEMYGEFFDIPSPDELLLISWFEGGEVFRSGCTFTRGKGRIFYFRPGHETYPIYHEPIIQQILANAVVWAAPQGSKYFGQARQIDTPT